MTEQPTIAEQETRTSFWASFTQADMRVLVITFAGTLAANIVTVLVVAVAVVVARSSAHPKPTGSSVLSTMGLYWED